MHRLLYWMKRQLERAPQNHSCNLHAPFCGTFVPNSVVVARYDALIRDKFPTNCDAHLAESIFQTRSSVDPENEHLIQAAISELTKGKTIVTIAHRLATIEQADQILVVDDGQIVQRGTHEELVAVSGKYKDFIDIRSQSESWKIG